MKFKVISTIGVICVVGGGIYATQVNNNNKEVIKDSKQVEVVQEVQISNESLEPVIEPVEQSQEELHFNINNVREESNLTVEQIQDVLEGTSLYPLAQDYIDLEEQYGINALFILSLTIEESGWGTSRIAHDNNNISGQRINGVYREFTSKYACLKETYRLISEEYINEEGKYYVGSSSIYDINATYCPDTPKDSWANNIIEISKGIRSKLG